jgi:hypothetical protein
VLKHTRFKRPQNLTEKQEVTLAALLRFNLRALAQAAWRADGADVNVRRHSAHRRRHTLQRATDRRSIPALGGGSRSRSLALSADARNRAVDDVEVDGHATQAAARQWPLRFTSCTLTLRPALR